MSALRVNQHMLPFNIPQTVTFMSTVLLYFCFRNLE